MENIIIIKVTWYKDSNFQKINQRASEGRLYDYIMAKSKLKTLPAVFQHNYLGLRVEGKRVGLTSLVVLVAAAARKLSSAAEVNNEAESLGPKGTKLLKPYIPALP